MKGIDAALTGAVWQDAQLRTAKSGRQWLSLSVVVGEEPEQQWVQVAAFFGDIDVLATQLVKGIETYIEGKIKLRIWEGADGPRAGLSVVASVIQPLGLIGQKRPKKPRPNGTGKPKTDPNAPLPFDDVLPF